MNRQILRLAFPNIISNLTIPLLGMVDLAVMGHLDSEVYIGAIALGGVIFNFIYWGFGFLRMGTSGFTAQAYGARDLSETMHTLFRAVLVGVSGGLILIILRRPIGWISFSILEGSQEVESLARQYFMIRILGAPATIALYGLTGWFIGMQNTKIPMVIAILVNGMNIGFNFLFVYGMGMRADGVALGTVLAQYTGLLIALLFLFRYYRRLFHYFNKKLAWQVTAFKRFFSVNADIFIRTLLLIFVFSFFTSESAAQNDRMLAVNTLLLQFLMVFSYFTDGFAYAAEALVGRFIGAKNQAKLKQTIRLLFRWGLGISLPFTILYALFGNQFLHVLTNNEEVVAASQPYFWWVLLMPLAGFPSYLWDGIFIGATAGKEMRNSMIIAVLLVFIPIYLATRGALGNNGLWLALILFLIARGAAQWAFSRKAVYERIENRKSKIGDLSILNPPVH